MASQSVRIVRSLVLRMVLAAIVAGGAAAWYTTRLADSYRARVLLLMAPMPISYEKPPTTQIDFYGEEGTPYPKFLRMGYFNPLPMPDYKTLLTSEEMARRVRDRMREIYESRGLDAGGLSIERVRRSMDMQVRIFKQTQNELEYQQVVELLFTHTNPEIAAEAANFWSEESIKLAKEMRFIGSEGVLDFFDKQIKETEGLLEQERAAIETAQNEMSAAALETRLADFEKAITEAELSQVALEAENSRLNALVAIGDATSPGSTGGSLHSKAVENEFEIGALKARKAALEPRIVELRKALAAQRRLLERHEEKVAYYQKQLEELAMAQYAARLNAADVTPDFKIASPAFAPEEETGPMRSLIVLVAVFLAVLAVPVHFVTMHALRRYAQSLERELSA